MDCQPDLQSCCGRRLNGIPGTAWQAREAGPIRCTGKVMKRPQACMLSSPQQITSSRRDIVMTPTEPHIDPQVARFCWQNLQVDPSPDFPDADLLRDEEAQE